MRGDSWQRLVRLNTRLGSAVAVSPASESLAAATDEMLMILPLLCSIMRGRQPCSQLKSLQVVSHHQSRFLCHSTKGWRCPLPAC